MASRTKYNAGQEEFVQGFDDIWRGSGTNADQYELNTRMTQLKIPSVMKVIEQLQTIFPLVDKSKEELNQVFGRQNQNSARSVGDERISQKEYDDLRQQLHKKDYLIKTLENKQREDRAKSEEVTKLQRMNTELRQKIEDLETEKKTAKRDIDNLSRENTALKESVKGSAQKKRELESELDETKTRLSKMIGDKITDGNPDIANLSDENRPTKIAEKYTELYDNEWTDAFEAFENLGYDEKTIISNLLVILKLTKDQCDIISDRNSENITKAVYSTEHMPTVVPQEVKKQIKDIRKVAAPFTANQVQKEVSNYLSSKAGRKLSVVIKTTAVQTYIKKCTDICWLMVVQDPPLYFGPDVKENDGFDKSRFKEYTRSGSRVEYLVWPDLYLKEGSRLCKGVTQGCGDLTQKKIRARPESAPPAASRPHVSSPPVSQDIDRTTRPASSNTFHQPSVRYTDQTSSSNDWNYDQSTPTTYRHNDKPFMSKSVYPPTYTTSIRETAYTDRISRDEFYKYPPTDVDPHKWYTFLTNVRHYGYDSYSVKLFYGEMYEPMVQHYLALGGLTT